MISPPSHVLITPAKNEGHTIGDTIQSVLDQTLRPREWVIVSDGSTDSTNARVELASRSHPWIRLLPLSSGKFHQFGRIAYLIHAGLRHLNARDYDWLSLLDADIRLPPNYYHSVAAAFAADPRLGVTGGIVTDVGQPHRIPRNHQEIPGAVQCIRRSCFERVGGLLPIPQGGWDGVLCAMARMHGWRTNLLTDVFADHLKPRNISQGNPVRRKWQMGERDYAVGYHPCFELIKCLSLALRPPRVIGAAAWWLGFCRAALNHQPRPVPEEVVRFIRSEQLHRLHLPIPP